MTGRASRLERPEPPARRAVGPQWGRRHSRLWVASFAIFACTSPRPLATLKEKSGVVERDHASQVRVWKTADVGASFGLGDGVQTLADGTALLVLDDGSRVSLQPDTLIRFSDTPPQRQTLGFDVETGAASLHAASDPVSIQTRVGLARVEAGATVVFSRSGEGLRIVVEVGRAVFGSSPPLLAGSGVRVETDGRLASLDVPSAPDAGTPRLVPGASPEPAPAQPAPFNLVEVAARVRGRGARVRTERGWTALAEGSVRLTPGAELELARKTSVDLERDGEHARLEQNGSYVVAPRAGVLVAATRGSLLAGSEKQVRIAVPGGVIVVAPQGRVNVRLGKGGAALEVESRAAVIDGSGEPQQVRAGQRAMLGSDGRLRLEGSGLDYADVQIAVGESLVIHDPAPPTAVRFSFPGLCPELGVVELLGAGRSGEFAAGEGAVSLLLNRGSRRYRLRCGGDEKVVKQGKISVRADNGTRKVAARAPVSTLAADGHRYTVLYQNRLPTITVNWPDAPDVAELTLTHEFAGETKSIRLSEPRHTFESGRLPEGRHEFHFVGGGKISRHTRVDIQFDNAAPTATLDAPAVVAAAKPGDAVTISGIALPGWQVQVAERSAVQDAQGRFSLAAHWPSETRALSVRLSHPERGTHLYVRRGGKP